MKFQTTLGMIAGIGIAVGIAAATSSGVKAHQFNLSDARVGDGVPKSLTGKPGNAKKGRATAINRKKGNCLACHAMPAPEQADHGDIGPDLGGVADRLSEAEMRLRLIDSKQINEDTIMPSFYMSRRLFRVQKKWKNKTLLKAEEVEDIIAYLKTLK